MKDLDAVYSAATQQVAKVRPITLANIGPKVQGLNTSGQSSKFFLETEAWKLWCE